MNRYQQNTSHQQYSGMQPSTSHGYSNDSSYNYQQDQEWCTDQNQSYYSQDYQDPQQQQHFNNYNYNNSNFKQYNQRQNHRQNYHQQNNGQQYQNGFQQKWQNKKKRPHERVDQQGAPAASFSHYTNSQTNSPEPKRPQFHRQNSFPNSTSSQLLQNAQTPAAYQTPMSFGNQASWKVARMNRSNSQKRPKQPQQQNPDSVFSIQENKSKEWAEMLSKTISLLKGCKAGDEINVLINNLQPSRNSWVKIKDQVYNDLLKLITPMGIEKVKKIINLYF